MHKKWFVISLCFLLSCLFVTNVDALGSIVYKVKKGDTLWGIARMNQVDVKVLKKANHLTSDLIYPGDRLTIPAGKDGWKRSEKGVYFSKNDFDWLVKIIEAEAGGESYQGKVAVASVVLNRVLHKDYPDTITDVVFHRVKGVYQFSPVGDGRIYKAAPSKDSYRAAQEALKGLDPTSGALFFYNPRTARSNWIRSRVVIAEIGRHHFAH